MKRFSILAITVCLFVLLTAPNAFAEVTIDFEELSLADNSAYFGADGAGGFNTTAAHFNNSYTDFGGGFFSWSGWAYSNQIDTTTPGFGNQFSVFPGSGANRSTNFALGFTNPDDPNAATIDLPENTTPLSVDLTNTTYAALSMLQGDAFAKKFGGVNGTDEDFFLLTITGRDALGNVLGSIPFYLSDFRFQNSPQDFVLDQWATVDLRPLTGSTRLSFNLDSTDVGAFGINTPLYFALDNLTLAEVPEPSGITLLVVGALGILLRRRGRRIPNKNFG